MRKTTVLLALAAFASTGCDSEYPGGGPGRTNPDYLTPGATPGKPQLDSLLPGDRKILVYFTGGGNYFRSVCNVASTGAYASTGGTTKSPDTVSGLQNGVEYTCRVWAFSPSQKPSPGSDSLKTTPKIP